MNIYTALLIASSVCLSLGGYFLLGVVPPVLSLTTYVVVVVLLTLSYLAWRGNQTAINTGLVLAVLAIISSTSSQAHLTALSEIDDNLRITLLDVLMILGFYLFPGIYIVVRLKEMLKRRRALVDKKD
ncbi:MAG: hypothetical protein QXR57_03830 [Metallosphaera sp.]